MRGSNKCIEVFVTADYAETDPARFERNLYLLRKQVWRGKIKDKITDLNSSNFKSQLS